MSKRNVSILVALLVVGSGCGTDGRQGSVGATASGALTATAALRVLHASPDAPAVDVLVDGDSVLAAVPYKTGSPFFSVPAGSDALEVRPTGTTTDVIDLRTSLAAGRAYTAIAVGPVASIQALLLTDDVAPPTTGSVKLRIVHASPSAGPVDVYLTSPGADLATATPTLASVSFKDASAFLEVAAGGYEARITAPGAKTPVFDSGTIQLVAGSNLTIVAVDATGFSPVELVVLTGDAAKPSFEVLDTRAFLRVVHASSNAPAVDVLLDGTPVLEDVSFGQASGYLAVDSGTRRIQIDPTGTTMPVIDVAPTISAGLAYTILAVDLVAKIKPLLLEDDGTPPAEGAVKVRLVHAAALAGRVDAYVTAPDAPLGLEPAVAGLAFEAHTGYVQIPAGTYRVRVTLAGTRTVVIDTGALTLGSGEVHTAVALDPAPGKKAFGVLLLSDRTP
jgi:hypothetical protein